MILTAAVVESSSIPVATNVRVVVLSIAAQDGRTLIMVAKAIDLIKRMEDGEKLKASDVAE